LSSVCFFPKIENVRKKIFLLLAFFFLFKLVPLTFASSEFETNYNVTYEVFPSGKVAVTQEVALTNKLSNIYATQYSLIIKGGKIENIQANDGGGPLKTEIKKAGQETIINLTFNQQVVGTGKTLNFTLRYDALDLVRKNGQIWEINIPKLGNKEEIDNYTLFLKVPKSFGKPAFIKPPPVESNFDENYNIFRFTKNQIIQAGINAVFGEFQIFDFNLSYYLENPNSYLGEIEIALPPDTAFQKITYQQIEPLPVNVRVDNDGNWLAKYILNPKEKIIVKAKGKAKIFGQPQEFFPPPKKETLKNNLLPKKYWEADSPLIMSKAQELKTPQAIYNFVVKTLNYDFDKVEENPKRLGALQALSYPQNAICMEFTDLFIALCRAAGIPAREINGFAYTTNEKLTPLSLNTDVLHAWPEYYDEEKMAWIPVDPTWEKTTGGIDYFKRTDLNHFAFVIHGENSEFPLPVGSYKNSAIQEKNIQVTFGEYEEEKPPELKVDFNLPEKIYWGIKNKGEIVIKNLGSGASYRLNVKIKSSGVELTSSKKFPFSLEIFPPFASEKIELEIKPKFKDSFNPNLEVYLNDQKFTYSFKNGFFPEKVVLLFLGGILLGVGLVFLTKIKFYVRKSQ